MLLEFRLENFKSFLDPTVFSMVPAPKQKDLQYSLLTKKIDGITKVQKALCSSVIYGPNASGKSNIICAVDFLRSVVLRGNILDSSSFNGLNPTASFLPLAPNSSLVERKPVSLGITFLTEEFKVEYDIKLDLGEFLDTAYNRHISHESLKINEKLLFERKDGNIELAKNNLSNARMNTEEGRKLINQLSNEGLYPQELFLSNGFKNIVSPGVANKVLSWFRDDLRILYHSEKVRVGGSTNSETNQLVLEILSSAAKAIGSKSLSFSFDTESSTDKEKNILYSVVKELKGARTTINSEIYESYGTVRFMHMFPLILSAIENGTVLFIDEFDASIHPMAIMSLINVFHNEEINKKKAQLIFNTHNPIFLNSNLFRRDEIKFVDREENNSSTIYSLSDFGTSGVGGVRKTDDYMKNYFIDRYGAISRVDFSSLVSRLTEKKHHEKP